MQIDLAPRSAPPSIEATYKSREVEGWVDIYFYRKLGFQLANLFAKLKVTPSQASFLGCLCGVAAGHLYYYRNLAANLAGMALHVTANVLDNADGQLARLTNQGSRTGRIIDSLADHLIWLSIYVHLGLRCLGEGAFVPVALLTLASGLSHAMQGAAADYYRNAYLYFVKGRSRADFDSFSALQREYRLLSWRTQPWQKFLLAMYRNFTWQQELLLPGLKRLRDASKRAFPNEVPDSLQRRYRDSVAPMLKWWRWLMTNPRMFLLFILLLADRPAWYLWIQLTVFNFLLVCLLLQQSKMSESLLEPETGRREPA